MPASTLQVRNLYFSVLSAAWKLFFFNNLHFFQCIFLITATQLTIADFSSCIPEGKKNILYACLFIQGAMIWYMVYDKGKIFNLTFK